MKPMRDDQIQDFFNEFKRFLRNSGDLPKELVEEISTMNTITLQSSATSFTFQYVNDAGVTIATKFENITKDTEKS